jgi:hypothetical protein
VSELYHYVNSRAASTGKDLNLIPHYSEHIHMKTVSLVWFSKHVTVFTCIIKPEPLSNLSISLHDLFYLNSEMHANSFRQTFPISTWHRELFTVKVLFSRRHKQTSLSCRFIFSKQIKCYDIPCPNQDSSLVALEDLQSVCFIVNMYLGFSIVTPQQPVVCYIGKNMYFRGTSCRRPLRNRVTRFVDVIVTKASDKTWFLRVEGKILSHRRGNLKSCIVLLSFITRRHWYWLLWMWIYWVI